MCIVQLPPADNPIAVNKYINPKRATLDVNDAISGVAAHQKQRGMQNFVLRSLTEGLGRERISWNALPN
jgi:hypothetical protein